ncbi:MAG: hypothetical protein JXL67_02710 [Calditrichaeota bacterium]|nr:hypothetical protein [Calditrichota bacterium]
MSKAQRAESREQNKELRTKKKDKNIFQPPAMCLEPFLSLIRYPPPVGGSAHWQIFPFAV